MKAYLLISTENSSLITGTTNNFYCFQQSRIPADKRNKLKIKSSSPPFGATTLCGFSPSQPSLSKFFYPYLPPSRFLLSDFLDLP
jgi:hypothetical protein